MTAKKHWRPHRFTPLAQLTGHPAEETYQQGVDRGYHEGYETGLTQGVEQGKAQGLAEGRRTGEEQGRREALAHFEGLAAPIDELRRNLEALLTDYERALRKEVIDLVAKVSQQVIRTELTLQPERLLSLVDEALATLPRAPKTPIEVFLNREDLERLAKLDAARIKRWSLIPDASLQPGECRIRAGSREVDAGCRRRLEACMEQVGAQLLPEGPVAAASR